MGYHNDHLSDTNDYALRRTTHLPVALFATVDTTIAAIGCNRTQVRAFSGPIRPGAIARAMITLFGPVLGSISAVGSERTVGVARAVAAAVHAIVALLSGVFESVAALEFAAGVTKATRASVVRGVVTLLTGIELAVAARGWRRIPARAVGLACTCKRVAVSATVVANLTECGIDRMVTTVGCVAASGRA